MGRTTALVTLVAVLIEACATAGAPLSSEDRTPNRSSRGRWPLARCPAGAYGARLAGGSDTRPTPWPPGPRRGV